MKFLITFYIAGLLLFTGTYLLNEYSLKPVYFLWDKGKDLIVWIVLYGFVKREYEKLLIGLMIISGIRLILDVLYNTGVIEVNNRIGVAILFTLNIIYVLYATIKKNGVR